MAFSPPTVTGFNANPPSDDGTQNAANEVTWAKHKTKLGDPLKTALEALFTELSRFFSNDLDGAVTTPTDLEAALVAGLQGHLFGLGLSNNSTDATNDIDVAVGSARDGANAVTMQLTSSITKRLDAAWAVGTNQGGLDTGTIADTTYHVWLIRRSDTGVVDALFSTSATSPTMPTDYDQKRRIGSIRRVSSAILGFYQLGDLFQLKTDVSERSDSADVSWALITSAGLPAGISVQPVLSASITESGAGVSFMGVGDYRDTGQDAEVFLCSTNASAMRGTVVGGFFSNTSGQFHYVYNSFSSSFGSLRLLGWIDDRGRSA